MQIEILNTFIKNIEIKSNIFVIIYVTISRNKQKNDYISELPQKLLKYNDIFFNKKADILSIFKKKDHIIKFKKKNQRYISSYTTYLKLSY